VERTILTHPPGSKNSLQPDTPAAGESHKKDSTQGVADSLLAVCLCLADFHDAGFN
jgi:hypothetical protein